MLESIYVGMTGLLGYSRGLRVIANNTANMNTPGFKSSSLQFADMFYTGGNLSGGNASQNYDQVGFGLNTTGTAMSFKQGELRQTGNDLDMAVDGQGLFILQGADGQLSYTRAGQFKFDDNGVLVSRSGGEKVMGTDGSGGLVEITVAGQMLDQGRPTSRLKFLGNLSNTVTDQTAVGTVQVVDTGGVVHTLSVKFVTTEATTSGTKVRVDLMDGTAVVGSGSMVFVGGRPTPQTSVMNVTYVPAGQPPMTLALDFSADVVLFAGSTTLKMDSQDGLGPGTLSGTAFDGNGVLRMSYSNGQTVKGTRLALARFDSPDAVGALGNNQFEMLNKDAWHLGMAGEGAFGTVRTGQIEISNVDLSQEFSDLVIMQRGYQASSQVISTANDMLQELFSMKSK
ncbi:flagellar basal-body rod protein FlgF (plasmid) [Variovorax sp. PDNC026]|uniref:flagellar basal-body rod protein FlgF n=1 Tax=Variovorax sp. PDNC026 TaxID=2811425 RepID=UPI001963E0E1|nr:flagellar basal-body rod protein FlgF [Variovorax sp. PDNC026]QRY35503.1 flagellar basal-body rod protein FlgF [Variovorax sp. PDNC026]